MPLDQPTHHLRFASGPKRGCTSILAALDSNQAVNDVAALDQKLVHRLVDTVDLLSQIGQ
jgi:hypothetical protein